SIIERVTAECSRADTEINELARNAGNIALLEYWKSEWRPKRDQIETSMISYAEKIETLASHRSRLNYTHGYALFRKEVLRAVLHRYALFGAVPASEADIRENGLPGEAWDFL